MRLTPVLFTVALTLSLFTLGCGGGSADAPADAPAADAPAAEAGPMGDASIEGTVTFTGTAPQRRRLRLDSDCAALHDGVVLADNVMIADGGSLQSVFVYVKEGLTGTYSPPSEPVEFDQQGCMYDPHVFGVQTGQTIRILNSDPLLHNIHALPEDNRPFNFGMPNQGDTRDQSFRVNEVMVKIKCDVHPWMLAWAGVVPHPFHDVSGEDGGYDLDDLPAGTYTIEAWHEEYGTQTQTVTVGAGETAQVNFTFGAGA